MSKNIDLAKLNFNQGFNISGVEGDAVGGAGDINGDGVQDIIVGSPYSGVVYIVYGKKGGYSSTVSSSELSSNNQGFKITGGYNDLFGVSVNSVGDINGDGISDIIIGASFASFNVSNIQRTNAGKGYVIYGKNGGYSNIDIQTLSIDQGFVIMGENSYDNLGSSVSEAGDVNGDGISDIIIGAEHASFNTTNESRFKCGKSYIIYGKDSSYADIDLQNLSIDQGFAIIGAKNGDNLGSSVCMVGDINADNIQDIVIQADNATPYVNYKNRYNCGVTYVIYGKKGGYDSTIDLNQSFNGFPIYGSISNSVGLGTGGVNGAGDFNGDGIQDIIIGSVNNSPSLNGLVRNKAGASYIVYGSKVSNNVSIDLDQLQPKGFIIIGANAGDYSGASPSSVGDFNGDGVSDIMIGASKASVNISGTARTECGVSYVIYGKKGGYSSYIDLKALKDSDGFSIFGAESNYNSGVAGSGAGDVNGDGIPDAVIGLVTNVVYGNKGNNNPVQSSEDSNSNNIPSSDSNNLKSWLSPSNLWQAVKNLWTNKSSNNNFDNQEQIYTFEAYLKDCEQALLSPNTHSVFLDKLHQWKSEGKINFERDFDQDFAEGFKLSLSSMSGDSQYNMYIEECFTQFNEYQQISENNLLNNDISGISKFAQPNLMGNSFEFSINHEYMLGN